MEKENINLTILLNLDKMVDMLLELFMSYFHF